MSNLGASFAHAYMRRYIIGRMAVVLRGDLGHLWDMIVGVVVVFEPQRFEVFNFVVPSPCQVNAK